MQVIFEYLPLRQVIPLQILNKKCYKVIQYTMRSIKFVDYDDLVFQRLQCSTRLLLIGGETKVYQICSLQTNYTQKEQPCNFEEGETYFSLFQTEGYGSKTVQISPTEYIFIN